MAVSNSSIPMSTGLTTTSVAGKGQATGKANGKGNAFGSLLLAGGDANTTATDGDKKQADSLQAMLAALNGGLTPMMLNLPQPLQNIGQKSTADTPASITLTLGKQMLPLNLQNLQLNNGELAVLLQKFGASPALMSALLANPQGQVAASLAAHPEILNDLENALSKATQQALQTPAMLVDPKLAGLVQTIMTEAGQGQTATGDQNLAGKQQPALLGKLQASISAHTVDANAAEVKSSANDETAQPISMTSNNLLLGAQVQLPLQPQVGPTAVEPNVVLMQADRFNTEFADLVVKRAALIESPGSQEFRILLQPQGMGEIEVRVQAVGNQISLQLSADNAASKSLLDSGLSALKNQLQAQGIQFDRIEVTDSSLNSNMNNNSGPFSGLPQERGNGQSFQGQNGGRSSSKRDDRSFAIEGIDSLETLGETMPEDSNPELAGIDVSA